MRTFLPVRADATIALTLKDFLDLPLPVDALKFPSVLMVVPSILITSGGISNSSDALISKDSHISLKLSNVTLFSISRAFIDCN